MYAPSRIILFPSTAHHLAANMFACRQLQLSTSVTYYMYAPSLKVLFPSTTYFLAANMFVYN